MSSSQILLPVCLLQLTQEAMGAFIEFGHVTPLSMLDNQTVLTIRMNSDNERNDFNVFILNGSTPISKLLVSQKKGKPKLFCKVI